jgi:hypothetical protein
MRLLETDEVTDGKADLLMTSRDARQSSQEMSGI